MAAFEQGCENLYDGAQSRPQRRILAAGAVSPGTLTLYGLLGIYGIERDGHALSRAPEGFNALLEPRTFLLQPRRHMIAPPSAAARVRPR